MTLKYLYSFMFLDMYIDIYVKKGLRNDDFNQWNSLVKNFEPMSFNIRGKHFLNSNLSKSKKDKKKVQNF